MVRVARAIEYPSARNAAHGGDERVDLGQVAPFGEIWHAFDQAFHEVLGTAQGQFLYEDMAVVVPLFGTA